MTVLYVDVSHHDWDRRGGNLDWNAVRTATSPVMVARATYGDPGGWNRASRHFAAFQAGAKAAGFTTRGGYHNLIRGDQASINRQVDWLRSELDAHGCTWAMADIEPYAELVSANMWPRFADVQRFHDRWYQVDGRVMAWYIPRWFWSWRDKAPSLGEPDLTGLQGPLVQSHYAGGDGSAKTIYANAGGDAGTGWDDAYGGRLPDIWQYSSGADVDGASSNTDVNAFRGSLDQLRALLGGDDMNEAQAAELHNLHETVKWEIRPWLVNVTRLAERLEAAVETEKVRDAALKALLEAGGGSPDTAAILARVDAAAAAVRADIEQRHQAAMEELRRDRDAQVAALQAELGKLTAAAPAQPAG